MFDHFDHHQAADSGVLSQAVCLTAIAVSCISNHIIALLIIHVTGSNTTVTTMRDSHGNHNSWLLMQLTLRRVLKDYHTKLYSALNTIRKVFSVGWTLNSWEVQEMLYWKHDIRFEVTVEKNAVACISNTNAKCGVSWKLFASMNKTEWKQVFTPPLTNANSDCATRQTCRSKQKHHGCYITFKFIALKFADKCKINSKYQILVDTSIATTVHK
jgi:hypothetical protein